MKKICPQHGFSMVTAIFILVVLATLMAYMLKLNVVQQTTVVLNIQGARAMQAARAGIEYGIYQALSGAACSPAAASSETLNFPASEAALKAFSVRLDCQASAHNEGVTPLVFYTLTALAENGVYAQGADANPDYISRRLRVTVSSPPP